MTSLADHAAEAYVAGWALTEAPWTERIETGLTAAVAVACEHPDDPAVLEATLQLGQLDGIWATIYARRARLQRKHERAVLTAWKTATTGLDPADVVRVFRREAYLTSEATATKDPTRRWWQELGAAAALGWLRRLYAGGGYDALVAVLADAIRAGMAEGEANALALAAARAGRTGFPIDRAFKTAYTRLAADHTITQRAADTARRMIDATAGDVGRRLAKLAGDGAGEQDMTDGVRDVMDDRQAPTQGADWTVWGAILAGARALYSWMSGGSSSLPGGGPDTPSPPSPPPGSGPVLLDWITAADDRVCPVCDGYQASGPYTPGNVPEYPHPRCVVGSTRVSAPALEPLVVPPAEHARLAGSVAPPGSLAGNDGGPLAATAVTEAGRDFGRSHVRAVTDREYVGDVITICTAAGHELTATPNHPVATRGGWVPIAELAVGGYVLSSTRPEWVVAGIDPDVDDIPPRIEDVAQSFPVQLGPVPTAAEDFHSDGAGSEVHVVRADRLLVDHRQPGFTQPACKHQLGGRDVLGVGASGLRRAGAGFLLGDGDGPAAGGGVGGSGQPGTLFGSGLGHAVEHALAAVAGLYARFEQDPADGIAADAEGFCEGLLALAGDIAPDEIVSVRRHPFSGHVYNLETVEGWYISNAIVTHNCRCSVDLSPDSGSSSFLLALLDSFAN